MKNVYTLSFFEPEGMKGFNLITIALQETRLPGIGVLRNA